jgi:hypothetical protein
VKELRDLPYTLSYIIRKRTQYDNLMELPKEDRPSDQIIFGGTGEELEEFLEDVLYRRKANSGGKGSGLSILASEIE